jgi:peptidyl-prolyl cis-trans isomerase A (cyclophilin A)
MPLMPILALLFGWALQTPAPPVRVIFETELGSITFEVNVAKAPITAENFLKYVDGGLYDGGYINRSVRPDNTIRKDVEIQVIQFQRNRDKTKPSFPPIAMERTSVTGLTHLNGTMSMARSGPDSATASFSVVIGDQPSMDFGGKRNADGQGFAVFGRVIDGWEVIKKIHAAPTAPAGTQAAYGTETLAPVINVIKAYRAVK